MKLFAGACIVCCIFGYAYAAQLRYKVYEKRLVNSFICRFLICCSFLICVLVFPQPNDYECERVPFPPTDKTRAVPWATVNLDLPPVERWREVVEPRKAEIKELVDVIIQLIENITGSETIIKLIDSSMDGMWTTLPEPFKSELLGVARYTDIPVSRITLYNIFYELASYCTSIVAQDPNGVLYHARNLDYGEWFGWDMQRNTWLLPAYMRKLTLNLRFVNKANETIFESAQFGGYIGLITAFKPNAFSLTFNERDSWKHALNLIQWVLGDHKSYWTGFLTRTVLETQSTYADAKKMLSEAPLLSTAYFILGGVAPGEGCVITRLVGQPSDIWEMSNITEHPWFILQTNYDHWLPQPFNDDRETPGNTCMMQHGQAAMGYSAIFDVLSTVPNLNQETVYSSLMCTRCGDHLQTYLQYCPPDKRCPL